MKKTSILFCIALLISLSSCSTNSTIETNINNNEFNKEVINKFWNNLRSLEGETFYGQIVSPESASDSLFKNRDLVMYVAQCSDSIIKIPFYVGDDSSRTWVFTLLSNGIELKHDHRHKDGTPDSVTMYGGTTTNSGSENVQVFPADIFTANMLPWAYSNVWWIELKLDEYFSYNLRRVDTERVFSVKFSLKRE